MDNATPRTPRRALIAAGLVLGAVLVILGAARAPGAPGGAHLPDGVSVVR